MKKLVISGIGNRQSINKEFCTIQFDIYKQQEFFSYFKKFLIDMGFEKNSYIENFGEVEDECGHPTGKEEDIKTYIDVCRTFENKECKLIVFFGRKMIILLVEAKTKLKQKIANKILTFCTVKQRTIHKKKSKHLTARQ